ncbi:MAG: rod shape-determining protein MreC [Parcubacteria group bacterium Greene0714_21]|nr:MAG: rod shape-determining protein MreC [Parcubacteria group bacterium Greene0416_39]TSC97658.1 MAG: rod shape-determining protein MreC [Parcubacteria group bacterium Greene1014_47]TSD03888.1 MAG: rod shape-determining protein MreC [Parcubacteria group bacterium Greene0714_21]
MLSSSVKKRFLFPVILFLFILFFNFFPGPIRGFFHFVFAPFESLLWSVGSVEKKNNPFESENLMLKAEIAKLQDAKKENETLRIALALSKTSDFTFIVASILGKDAGSDTLVIRMPEQGIAKIGMPVITSDKVLAGKVSEVSDSFAKVLLISHPESSFDAKIPETNAVGLVRGQGRYRLLLDLVQKDEKLSLGNTVVTSSLGGTFPENLLVGTIKEIKDLPTQPFAQAFLEPFGNLQAEEFLLVITEF